MVYANETAVAVLVALGLFVVAEAVSIARALAAGRAARRAPAEDAVVVRRRRTTTRIPAAAR